MLLWSTSIFGFTYNKKLAKDSRFREPIIVSVLNMLNSFKSPRVGAWMKLMIDLKDSEASSLFFRNEFQSEFRNLLVQ